MKRKRSPKKVKNRVAATKDVTARKNRQRLPVFNLLVAVLCWLAVVVLFYSGRLVRPQKLILGQQAPDTIVASVDFNAETLSATQIKQREQAEQVLPVFTVDHSNLERAGQALIKLLPRLRSLPETEDPERKALIRDLIAERLDQYAISLTPEELLRIIPPKDIDLKEVVTQALTGPLDNGVVTEADLESKFNGIVAHGNVAVKSGKTETIRPLDSFSLQSTALQNAVRSIAEQLPREYRDEEVIQTLVSPWLRANVIYDTAETAARKKQAVELIDPVIEPVAGGTVLIRDGDPVSEQTLIWLAAHEQRLNELETPAERIQRLAARGLLLLLGMGLAVAIAGIISRPLLRSRKKALLLLILSFLPMLFGKLFLYLTVNLQLLSPAVIDYLVPPGIAIILASVLAGGTAGILVGLWSSFALAALLDNSFEVFVLGLLVTVTAVYTTRDVKRRSTLLRAGLWVGAVKMLFALVLAVLNQPSWWVLLTQLGTALVSGLVSALLATLLIPVFEHLFNVTTDISLLELSDLSHPLLQSLAINAPGTYHHSLMMASLAQNAAEAIGANGLQLRVCAYFHDIGKLVKPGFFSENIQYTENPHDDLAPSMSTLVIVSHIKEGVTLAKKHKLPQVVIDGIEQHQGTSLVSVFYHRAKTQQQKELAADGSASSKINDEDFRYEGPRPQNREMAILMLADSCEAASRSLDKPTPVRISNLISDIFDSRLRDGQLDECNLTLAELHTIKESFVFSLTNMLHGRVAYPKDENNTDKQSDRNSDKPSETPPTDK
ncbi:HD family phosphohydrolase [Tichowtungia aerotolerans]|uniref:HDIG domain-containing protein n=1 Tax=Tichowtungia aerotolerans TaxID=2697043 RepID=A0A6P1M494_9BACT|nr:HDIG domain-containing metalloprotein [Tichowtungia aerotolerans]QHI68852.1 HDIG domain-containing protein [Tichowtungia aerotolerans]